MGEEYFYVDEQGTRVRTSQPGGLPHSGMMDLGPWGEDPLVVIGYDPGAKNWIADGGYYLEPNLTRMLYYVRARWFQLGGPGWLSRDPIGFEDIEPEGRGGARDCYSFNDYVRAECRCKDMGMLFEPNPPSVLATWFSR